MANIVRFINNKAEYLQSVNTPDYIASNTVLIEPDITEVVNVPLKYWKKGTGNKVVEMTQAEKDAVLAGELAERRLSAETFATNSVAIFTTLIKVINLRLPSGQKITKQELIDAVKAEII